MRFFKLLKYDLKNGFLLNFVNLFIIILLVIAFCIDFYLRVDGAYFLEESIPSATFTDYLLYIFAGVKEYIPSMTENFLFPVKWLLLILYILYSTLYYPFRDLSSMGLNIIVRTKGRISWWVSKFIWTICYVLVCYLLIFMTVIVFCVIMQEPISLEITPMFVNDLLGADSQNDVFPIQLAYITLLFPMFISIGLNLLQMTLALFVKPLYSFGMIAIILLSSTYIFTPYLPGNYAMPIRSIYVVENGVSFSGGIITIVILIFISFIVGSLYFRRYDILDIE